VPFGNTAPARPVAVVIGRNSPPPIAGPGNKDSGTPNMGFRKLVRDLWMVGDIHPVVRSSKPPLRKRRET
jgi:hypothetical protein